MPRRSAASNAVRLFGLAPVHKVPVQASVLRSVHQIGVQLVPRFGRPDDLVSAGSPDPRQRSFEPGSSPIRPVMREPLAEEPASGPGFLPPFGHRHSLPGSSCARWGIPLPSRSAYRQISRRTPSGLSRSACDRYGRGGRPLNPGDGGALPAGQVRPAGTCRLPTAGPCSPASCNPPARVLMTRRHRGFTHVHPSGLPQPVAPGRNRSPWALPRASHPAVTRDARQGRDGPCALDRVLRRRHQSTLLRQIPLSTCDFVSHDLVDPR